MHKPNRSILWVLALSVNLVGAASFAAPAVFGETASVKVRPSFPARDDHGVDLVAARNEFASFQVVVHGATAGATGVTAALTGLTGPSSIGSDRITLYREALINIAQPSGTAGATGVWPDGLVPDVDEVAHEKRKAFPFDVPANEARAIWVDVHVPPTAEPGSYTGTVSVTGSGFTAQVPVRLTVVAANMPSTSSLPSAFLIFAGNVCSVQTGTSDCGTATNMASQLDKYARVALDHRISLSNIYVVGRDGTNWPAFDQQYAPLLDGTAATKLQGAALTSAQLPRTRTVELFRGWANHFKSKAWFDKLFDYTGDEPPYGISFAEAGTRAQMTRTADPAIRTLLTTTITALDQNSLTSLFDMVVPVVNHMDGTAAPYAGSQRSKYDGFLQKPQSSLWMYQSCMSHGCAYGTNLPENTAGSGWPSYMIDKTAAKNRAMQWVIFKYGATGELYYETANALLTAWSDQFRFSGNGDGTLFYPGTPSAIGGSSTVPLPSIRMKQIRQGMQDYEWLKLVSDAGDPAFAKQVADELIPSAHQVGDDGTKFDAARMKLINRYVELTAPLQGNVVPLPGSGTGTGEPIPNQSPDTTGSNEQPIWNEQVPGSAGGVQAGCSASGAEGLAFAALGVLATLIRRRRR